MKSKKGFVFVALGVLLFAAVCAAGGSFLYRKTEEKRLREMQEQLESTPVSQSNDDAVTFDGKSYVYNKNLMNILFMGVDKREEVELMDTPGYAGQADSIILLSLDKETKEARLLQISRDSMTDIDLYDDKGDYLTSVNAQLATQYAYGNGTQSSCWAMKKTVSELLYDLPIDAYISMNLESISIINDAVGGVTLTIPEDYTEIDPAFKKGETVTLDGAQAERYVRYRDTGKAGTNAGRMERQVQYIPALIAAVKNKYGDTGDYYEKFAPLISDYMVTDMSADQIDSLADYQLMTDSVEYVPGEIRQGDKNEEFHVNDAELQKLLIKLFYILE